MAQAGFVGTRVFWVRVSPWAALLLVIIASLGLTASASAKLSGNYSKFANCPYTNPEASKCIYSTTVGGEVVFGSRKVPIVNPAVLQGAYTEPDAKGFAKFIGATNGITLSKADQPVPGGLVGIVPPEGSPPLVKAVTTLISENDLTKVSATLELAKPPSSIRFSEKNLGGEEGTALSLPIKIHLENPFLGPSCYIGSSSSPITWNLSTGVTTPPKPTKPISGTVGAVEFLEEGRVIETKGSSLVDNAWAIPVASGCGGFLSFLINPIANTAAGLPAAAGTSVATLENSAFITSVTAVQKNAE